MSAPESRDRAALEPVDLSIFVMPTSWDPAALTQTLRSAELFIRSSGLKAECVLVEFIQDGVNVSNFHDQDIPGLPDVVLQYIDQADFGYVVEYGTSTRALRRVIKCARGEHVCFLREGDRIGYRVAAPTRIDAADISIGVTVANADSLAALQRLGATHGAGEGLAALAALIGSYDGAVIVRRDLLAGRLARTNVICQRSYATAINQIAVEAMLGEAVSVRICEQVSVAPDAKNLRSFLDAAKALPPETWKTLIETAGAYVETDGRRILTWLLQSMMSKVFGNAGAALSINDAMGHRVPWLPAFNVAAFSRAVDWCATQAARLAAIEDGVARHPGARSAIELRQPRRDVKVSIVSSAFRGQALIFSFVENLVSQSVFHESEIVLVSPQHNLAQQLVVDAFSFCFPGIRPINLDRDPGLYECWNLAIRESKGTFLTNANIDDRRHHRHLEKVVSALEKTGADVGSAAMAVTKSAHEISDFAQFNVGQALEPRWEVWYTNRDAEIERKSQADFFVLDRHGNVQQCMNFPHCMPIWRRTVHDVVGYFDERTNGTYSDFALWLEGAAKGVTFVHLSAALGLYLIDENSHNRSNSNEHQWEAIVRKHLPKGAQITASTHVANKAGAAPKTRVQPVPQLNFGQQFGQNFGRHRSGWTYAISQLKPFHDESAPVLCETFLEKKFVWGGDYGDAGGPDPIPYSKDWVGFIHVPPQVPRWFQFEQSNEQLFRTKLWKKSEPHCRGLFCLTDYHKRYLEALLKPRFPISVLSHPTEIPDAKFSVERYRENPKKRVIQVGWWLRKLNAISVIDTPGHTPTLLGKSDWTKNLLSYAERRYYDLLAKPSVDVIDFVDNDAYDKLLAENLIFIDFYDTCANNAVIECMARRTPLIVCRHPAAEEYLGKSYPLYYDHYEDIPRIVSDSGRIKAAVEALGEASVQRLIDPEVFKKGFLESEVVRALS